MTTLAEKVRTVASELDHVRSQAVEAMLQDAVRRNGGLHGLVQVHRDTVNGGTLSYVELDGDVFREVGCVEVRYEDLSVQVIKRALEDWEPVTGPKP